MFFKETCQCIHKYVVGDRFRSFYKSGREYGVIINSISDGKYHFEYYHDNYKSEFDSIGLEEFEDFYKNFKLIGKNTYTYKGQKEIEVGYIKKLN